MKHIKKIASYSMVGSFGLTIVAGLNGCDAPQDPMQQKAQPNGDQGGMQTLQSDLQQQNYFLVIEQIAANPDRYQLAEKYPTEGETRAVLRGLDGKETILSNAELKALAEEEAKKVEAGTSELTKEASASASPGLGLGEMILASAAGALIGNMIANKLANNQNFKRNQQANTRPSARVSRTATPRSAPKSTQKAKPRSGFFGGNRSGSSSGAARSFGG